LTAELAVGQQRQESFLAATDREYPFIFFSPESISALLE
jgi:hypothetical protein